MKREFTGRHMAIVMVSFFGVVIAVNLVMATFATRTFGGTVVDNSYVASQRYNGWLEKARQQAELQWDVRPQIDPEGHLIARASTPAGALVGAIFAVKASHPVGRAPDREMILRASAPGMYRSSEPLPEGRWLIQLSVKRDGREARYRSEVRR